MTLLKSRPARGSKQNARQIKRNAQPAVEPERCTVFSTELGWILVSWQGDALTLISFGHASPAAAAQRGTTEPVEADEAPKWIKQLSGQIQRFSQGKQVDWGKVPLQWPSRTAFQQKVQEACRQIPRGQVRSYGELAAAVGAPGAARAVGSVMRTNRFPLIIPCHRVVASGGNLGGFSCPQGIDVKQKLLALEGVQLRTKGK
ncbi:Methylated-DNA--protein-cysteine methyltransferase, constitutive [Anatilimnocola aggregata]|uniref:methylated-DNA--[protein]-cysteine S-methyltransferase n=1 Tax=Anatilimnocola aggregata TaxID=2528021 RepID=A0A517YMX4_9BACT|nr:methylated-DNA--[protein]-cysteine S-methyltransferase [Anatilimnocola aggregata]QDU31564.1 Methylated-DNA--protein-cysteine methyltransferase, constitutive [Anatilimnocola aggregata]